MDPQRDRYLRDIYFNPANPASFSSPLKLYKFIQKEGKFSLTLKQITKWIQAEESYTTQKQNISKFKKQKIVVPHIAYQWEVDTANMTYYNKKNDGFGYFVVVVDAFSRYAYTKPLKTTTGTEMVNVLSEILQNTRPPRVLRSDGGSEFNNISMKKFLHKHKIKHIVTRNEVKCAIAERFIKTMKTLLTRYMIKKHNPRWTDALPSLTDSYNNTYHRTLGMSPSEVTVDNENDIWQRMYDKIPKTRKKREPNTKFKFQVGDIVRLSKLKYVFDRAYDTHWTTELFSITERAKKQGLSMYRVKDYANDPIDGVFYEQELQRVYVGDDTSYNIEKIVKKRTRRGVKEVLVHWQGWPAKYRSWIRESDIERFEAV
jgi:hypothetical protein